MRCWKDRKRIKRETDREEEWSKRKRQRRENEEEAVV